MSRTPHTLAEEFPQQAARIAELTASDAHFRRIAGEYEAVNEAIHRAETNLEPTDQFREEDLRKARLWLKDEIAQQLAAAA